MPQHSFLPEGTCIVIPSERFTYGCTNTVIGHNRNNEGQWRMIPNSRLHLCTLGPCLVEPIALPTVQERLAYYGSSWESLLTPHHTVAWRYTLLDGMRLVLVLSPAGIDQSLLFQDTCIGFEQQSWRHLFPPGTFD